MKLGWDLHEDRYNLMPIRIWIGINMEIQIWIQINIKVMLIHNGIYCTGDGLDLGVHLPSRL